MHARNAPPVLSPLIFPLLRSRRLRTVPAAQYTILAIRHGQASSALASGIGTMYRHDQPGSALFSRRIQNDQPAPAFLSPAQARCGLVRSCALPVQALSPLSGFAMADQPNASFATRTIKPHTSCMLRDGPSPKNPVLLHASCSIPLFTY